jgi:hypothetical protein
MYDPAFAITGLTCGVLMLGPCLMTLRKIYNGSKTTFSYVMMLFTLGYSVCDVVTFLDLTLDVNQVKARCYQNYVYFLLAIQSWLFACRYLESAQRCRVSTEINTIQRIKWAVISVYIVALTVV